MLLVDEHGWVAQSSGIAVRDRIAVPRGDQAIAIPGMGLCLPEAVGNGWLVRPAGPDTTVRLALDLCGPPVIEVSGGQATWRSSVTARHAETLRLLHQAGPAGLSAAMLSTALYGDADHVVAARAEVSRPRKILGAVVATRPYRLADGVELRIEPG